MHAQIHLRLLGPFDAAAIGYHTTPIRLSSRKARALLAYLATSSDRSISREQLAALLWASSSDEKARHSLRQTLADLRKELDCPDLFQGDGATINLRPNRISVDIWQLKSLAGSEELAELKRAVGLARGEFLEGLYLDEEEFDVWIQYQRRRFSVMTSGILENYARKCDLIGQSNEAIEAAERLLAMDSLNEDWQRLALRLYARHRGPKHALAQGAHFEALLKRELGVAPETQTIKLIAVIRSQALAFDESTALVMRPNKAAELAATPVLSTPAFLNALEDLPYDHAAVANGLSGGGSPRARWHPQGIGLRYLNGMVAVLVLAGALIGWPLLHPTNERQTQTTDNSPGTPTTDLSYPWQPPLLPKTLAAPSPAPAFPADAGFRLMRAESLLRQATGEDPNDSRAHFSIGLVHEARVELREAIESYRRSLEINPSNAPAYAQMGHILLDTGHALEGLDYIKYALRLSPNDPHRSHWLRFAGECALELNDLHNALEYLQKSYDLNPHHPLTLLSLVAAYSAVARQDDVHKYLTELKNNAPQVSNRRLLRRLVKLKNAQPVLFKVVKTAFADISW